MNETPQRRVIPDKRITDWHVIARGAVGIELGLVGFGRGRDLFHRYLKLGVVTLYITTRPLPRFLAMYREARDVLRGCK